MEQRKLRRPLMVKLFLVPILMFGFGYLMIPLYDVFCEVTGLNGKTGRLSTADAEGFQTNKERLIKVEFDANVNESGLWEFRPEQHTMMVHPGLSYSTSFFAKNKLDKVVTSQSVPSVAPSKASPYFSKTECFCFTEQEFKANEGRDMPLVFVIDPEVDDDVDTITLSYTLFTKKDTASSNSAHLTVTSLID